MQEVMADPVLEVDEVPHGQREQVILPQLVQLKELMEAQEIQVEEDQAAVVEQLLQVLRRFLPQVQQVVLVVLELHHQSTHHQQQELAAVEEVQHLQQMIQEVLVGLAVVEQALVVVQLEVLQELLILVVAAVEAQVHLVQLPQELVVPE